ncbi:P-loop containing nucleoside triphosphate hydrolase protein [Dioscorea alata]|uniref:P-loop containing nucleoside triphosphate hydrolase protein n=1 Tax=Dioscorea alata TaxID=55571 RepID=A0ACB7UPL1_DIOAL|nr:P-loop containing nucleoside triphosphate hydrolase protein [Dioscorea alata]
MVVVSAFLRGLCQRLQATIAANDELPLGIDKELGRLLKAFVSIKVTTLEAAENKQSKSKVVQAWLCELKEAAYDADDLLDCLVMKAQEPEVEASVTDVVDQRRCLIFNCGQEHAATQTELMIQDIRSRVQKLMRKKPFSLNFHHRRSSNYMSHYEVEARKATSANSGKFGRDEDREKMIKLLTSEESCSHEDLSLIAIVGRPGVGKTTLARIVYDEPRVASHFPLKMWATASEVYDAGRLLRSIYESVDGYPLDDSVTMEIIVAMLKNTLAQSRYLLILDDVRNEIFNSELLQEQLKYGPSGSKIVITAENEEIAKKMRLPSLCYNLQGLSREDSWSFFKECALPIDQGSCKNSREIEEVGLKIVAKLEGLPLAVRMVGRLLCLNFNLNDWKMISNADVWRYKSEELRGVPAALWLSYQHLPPHIKQCFGCCSVFPRDHKFDKQSTVHMWMAEGLIQPQQGKQMEDLGNEYFDYLLNRSFFQFSSRRDESVAHEGIQFFDEENISEEYIMHGLIHDLALSITVCESLWLSPVSRSMKENVRHLSVWSDKDTIASVLDIGMLHNLRTLLFERIGSSSFDYDALFMNLRCIRVLCLSDIGLKNLPDSIGNLKQLRCLDLTNTSVTTVPHDLSLIAIVGRPGVGKTTLAQNVYNEPRVNRHFRLKMWITASEIYDAGRLLRSIEGSASASDFFTLEDAVTKVKYTLAQSRYLLILDDVRNEILNPELLREQLKYAPSGSKIVITTENEEIAKKMRLPFLCYYLQGLSHGDSWSLFKECALLLHQGACQNSKEIEEVGLEIVTKLEGLPLAVRMVGHLLCLNFDLNDWKMILKADIWRYKSEELRGVPAALWLSYQHLPPHIKQCFGYCSVFPRDHKFDKQSTVHMWMAQGLIQPQQGKQMEDLGNEYFDYLLNRSFFQFSICRKYVMHGLIHDLALSISVCESLCLSPLARDMKGNVRHLSVQSDKDTIANVLDVGMLHNLRTLVFYRTGSSSFDYDALFMNLKCIRVLCLSDNRLMYLPDSIGDLKQLRCLDLTNTSVNTVPHVLCGLRNLQILNLNIRLITLQPFHHRGMSNLINLRHLKVLKVDEMYKIGQLTSLQELGKFTVLDEDGHRIEELKNMTQLRGKLCISQLENVHTKDEAMEAKLNEKELIEELVLQWSWDYTWDGRPVESKFATLEALRPHANLKTLIIESNTGGKIPTWLEDGSLSSLETLEIRHCYDWDISLLRQLKSLKILRLYGMLRTQHVDMHNDRDVHQLFPCLRILDISRWPGFFETLHIKDCPKLRHQPADNSGPTLPSSLIDFKVLKCAGLTSDSFFVGMGRLHSLSSMVIKGEPAFDTDCPPEHLPVFTTLPWALVSLKRLKVAGCPRLAACSSSSDKSPMLLEYLEIKDSSLQILNGELLHSLINLQELKISECYELVNFPNEMEEGLHCLVSLKRLFIDSCYSIDSLPRELATIPSLEEVCVTDCHSIESIPEKGLPASLSMLIINRCGYLEQRCDKDGEDWSKISHVFYIEIDKRNVREETFS